MSLNDKVIYNIFKDVDFLKKYEIYKEKHIKSIKMIEFLNSIDINKSYYKLNLVNTLAELKIKTINGYLNKLTSSNLNDTTEKIKLEIQKDINLIDITIKCILEKCILQKSYMKYYIDILSELNLKYDICENIRKEIDLYILLFDKQETDHIETKYKQQYLSLCEKNKITDNYICFFETIYYLESNKLLFNLYDSMMNTFFDKIDECLLISSDNKNIFKYINCMSNIYIGLNFCPINIKNKFKCIKSRLKDKKIIFKIMDILEL